MTGSAETTSGKNISAVMGDCKDVKGERTALHRVVDSHGHVLIASSEAMGLQIGVKCLICKTQS